jgi:hypothetical protein
VSSSTSSSDSSSSAHSCSGDEGEIFNNCLVTGELTSYVYYQSGVGETSTEGEIGSHIQWNLVDLGGSHGNVIEVMFNALDDTETQNDSGWFGITVGQNQPAVDLSEYANGSINFDVRIIQNGWYNDIYEFSMECGWPCASDALWVQEPTIGEWKSYSISLDRVIRSGLDISKVYNLFMFKPGWGLQKGKYIFQIDNIRLSKDYTDEIIVPPPKPTTDKLKNYYVNGSDVESNFAVTNNELGNNVFMTEIQSGLEKFIDIQYLSNVAAEFYIYPINSAQYDMTDFYHGNLVFDIKVSNYSDETGKIIVNSFCFWPCRAVPAYNVGRPPLDQWTTHIVPIKQLVKDGLLLHRMFNGFHLKYSSDVRTGLNIQLKNIRWEFKAEN